MYSWSVILGDENTATPITVGVFGTWGTDGRQYPWGDEFDPSRCNICEGGSGDTTLVGQHPTGASPYGALDMAGNVWE